MEPNKQIYQIFSAFPDFLSVLTDSETEEKYNRVESLKIKKIQRPFEGLFIPENPSSTHHLLEVQMEKEKPEESVYNYLVIGVAELSMRDPEITYQGKLLFANRECDPKTEPWHEMFSKKGSYFPIYYLDELWEKLAKKDPYHPLVLLLKAFFAKNNPDLVQELPETYQQLEKTDLDPEKKETLLQIFISWTKKSRPHMPPEDVKSWLQPPHSQIF